MTPSSFRTINIAQGWSILGYHRWSIFSCHSDDVLIYALTLAHEFGFDPGDVIQNKMRMNSEKYPVEKVKGRSDKYTAY